MPCILDKEKYENSEIPLINKYIEIENNKYLCLNMIDFYYQQYKLYPLNKKVIEIFFLLQDQILLAPDGLPYTFDKKVVIEYLDKIENSLSKKDKKYIIKAIGILFNELILEKAEKERKKLQNDIKSSNKLT